MVFGLGLGWWGGALLLLGTLTTNFVNIYMSALALKSLAPNMPDSAAIGLIGGIGAVISVLSTAWLDQLATFTLVLAGAFVPVGGLLLAHYTLRAAPEDVTALYPGAAGEPARVGAWSAAGLTAWAAGALVFYVAQPIGGVLPSLAVSVGMYLLIKGSRR